MRLSNFSRCGQVGLALGIAASTAAPIGPQCNHAKDSKVSAAASDAAKRSPSIRRPQKKPERNFCKAATSPDRLLGQESLQHFDKAIALFDPDFASAELARATNSNTAGGISSSIRRRRRACRQGF